MGVLNEYDERKQRSVALFASSVACSDAVRNHITENKDQTFDLVIVDEDPRLRPDGPGLPRLIEELFGPDCFHAENIGNLPANVGDINLSDQVEPTVLISISEMVWFRYWAEPITPDPGDGSWIFGTYITLGSQLFGLPFKCYDEEGAQIDSPLQDIFADSMKEEFADWQTSRREYTEELKSERLKLVPDCDLNLLVTENGTSVEIGSIDLPLDLMWRLRRLEKWIHSHSPWGKWTDDDKALCDTEGKACAESLSQKLGVEVKYGFD
ncbi:MAG: hypothetical protein MPJ78_12985 [Hyphomicrobiaceae bacterium]|nr:hypothetical protein [Hyphomicrobiaceae bacterium]